MRQLYSVEAEQSVIGCLLLDPSKHDEIGNLITASDFHLPETRLAYELVEQQIHDGHPVDVVTIGELAESRGQGGTVPMDWLIDVATNTPSAYNAEGYARIVMNYARERRLYNVGIEIQSAVMAEDMTTDQRIQVAESLLTGINEESGAEIRSVGLFEAAKQFLDRLDYLSNTGRTQGILCGLEGVDKRLGGWKPGELYVVGARPGMGKTTYATNALIAAISAGYKTYFASLEMPTHQLMQRMFATMGRINLNGLKDASVVKDPDQVGRLSNAAHLMSKAGNEAMTIVDTGINDIDDLRSDCRRARRVNGEINLIVVDYLQLLNDRTCQGRYETVSSVSRKLKSLAKELNCAVMALSQLNRELEKRPRTERRPVSSDLRESGQIEQDADVIQFLYRDEVYNEDTPYKGVMEIITEKYRDGERGTDYAAFIGSQNRLEDLAPDFRIEQYQQSMTAQKQPKGFQI